MPNWGRANHVRVHSMFPKSLLERALVMTRLPLLSSPLLLGFEDIERLIGRVGKSGGEGYPPYNIERVSNGGTGEVLRITLAVAGFAREQLDITLEDNQLLVRGKQEDDKAREYLHRGIATRQFARTFVLADGIEVKAADLADGLLRIDLVRHEPNRLVRRIEIATVRKP
jgi:HSP20 family molecular chaperone IbpA